MRFKILICIMVCNFVVAQHAVPIYSADTSLTNEKITYNILKLGMKAGKATIEFKGNEVFENKEATLIVFTAKALRFYDQEKIYVDPKTLLPIAVERDLDIFGKKEKITEHYAPGEIHIVKEVNGKIEEQTIKKPGQVDNIYAFIYRKRRDNDFNVGKMEVMNLPTKDVKIGITKTMKLRVNSQMYDTFVFASDPAQYTVWFDQKNKTALRIDGSAGLGKTSLVLTGLDK